MRFAVINIRGIEDRGRIYQSSEW